MLSRSDGKDYFHANFQVVLLEVIETFFVGLRQESYQQKPSRK